MGQATVLDRPRICSEHQKRKYYDNMAAMPVHLQRFMYIVQYTECNAEISFLCVENRQNNKLIFVELCWECVFFTESVPNENSVTAKTNQTNKQKKEIAYKCSCHSVHLFFATF